MNKLQKITYTVVSVTGVKHKPEFTWKVECNDMIGKFLITITHYRIFIIILIARVLIRNIVMLPHYQRELF